MAPVILYNHGCGNIHVGLGEISLSKPFRTDNQPADGHIKFVLLEVFEKCFVGPWDKLRLNPKLPGQFVQELHVKTNQIAFFVIIREGQVFTVIANPQLATFDDRLKMTFFNYHLF